MMAPSTNTSTRNDDLFRQQQELENATKQKQQQQQQQKQSSPAQASTLDHISSVLMEKWNRTNKAQVVFFLKNHIPILEWLPKYDLKEDLQYDLVAGITVAMMLVPQEISLSTMMGVPPIYGLYTAAIVPMIYPFFGTSRVLSVANGAEVSLLVGSAIKKISSEEERIATGVLLSFLSGLFLLLMGFFRLGILADFFSRPVMGGFVSAGGILIILSQISNWFGFEKVPSRDLPILSLLDLIEALPHMNFKSFFVGLFSICILIGMKHLKRKIIYEMAHLEEQLEDQVILETSRATAAAVAVAANTKKSDQTRQQQEDDGSDDDDDDEIVLEERPPPRKQQKSDQEEEEEEEQQQEHKELDDIPLSPTKRRRPFKHQEDDETQRQRQRQPLPPLDRRSHSSININCHTHTPGAVSIPTALYSTRSTSHSDLIHLHSGDTPHSRRLDLEATGAAVALDVLHVAKSSRHINSRMLLEDGVGFSLSDEDYLSLEQHPPPPKLLQQFWESGDRVIIEGGMELKIDETDDTERPTTTTTTTTTKTPGSIREAKQGRLSLNPQLYARVKNIDASPMVHIQSDQEDYGDDDEFDRVSITDSIGSSSHLMMQQQVLRNSGSIRLLRSKIAVLIALRLVCDLGAFLVCLFGGIIGYLAGEEHLILTGNVPGGYPTPIRPWYGLSNHIIEADRLYHLIIDTLSIALISYMSSIAMAKRLATREGYRIRPNQELVALGFSNIFGSFFQSMPATGGLSRTAVNMQNARTQLASIITVGVVVVALYTATSALAYLPKASLAAIILVAGHSLIEIKEAKWLYRIKRDEFYVWLASFVLTVLLGVLPGLLSSIFCSLIAVIYKTRRPTLTMLGEIIEQDEEEQKNTSGRTATTTITTTMTTITTTTTTIDPITGEKKQSTTSTIVDNSSIPKRKQRRIVDLELNPTLARPLADIVMLRVDGALYFANCEYIERVVTSEIKKRRQLTQSHQNVVKGVIIDVSSTIEWDSTTIQMMKYLKDVLLTEDIQLAIVHAREKLQRLLLSTEFIYGIVQNDATISIDQAIDAIRHTSVVS